MECVICHEPAEGPMIRYKGGEVHATCWGDLYGEDNSQLADDDDSEMEE